MTPKRIHRQRTKGWRLPENTVCVSRPSIFGNPFIVGRPSGYQFNDGGDDAPIIPVVSLGLRDKTPTATGKIKKSLGIANTWKTIPRFCLKVLRTIPQTL